MAKLTTSTKTTINESIFELIAMREKLKRWINQNYSPSKCAYSPYRSSGNDDDVFDDGFECGMSWAAYDIGEIIGIELPKPEKSDDDF